VTLEPSSLAVGMALGVVLAFVLAAVAVHMYAEAIADGRDGEAGFWGWLYLGP
jgi:hypothetical protein